jgi:hypothetical protein
MSVSTNYNYSIHVNDAIMEDICKEDTRASVTNQTLLS